jgi:hypothetical protein
MKKKNEKKMTLGTVKIAKLATKNPGTVSPTTTVIKTFICTTTNI